MSNDYATSSPSSSSPSSEDRTMALVAHLLGIVTWFIGPLVIWLISKDQPNKAFVVDQAKEALNFQISVTLVFIAAFILTIVSFFILSFLPFLVGIANLVLCIIAGMKANNGEVYRYPFTLRLVS